MKKYIFGGVLVLLLGGYALWSASRQAAPVPVTTTPSTGGMMGGTGMPMMGQYKDGVYTGAVGSAAPYGNVRIQATISGGKLASIKMLEVPSGPEETNQISARTFPKLVQEAITIQNAKVDTISGATQDSEGFRQSLASALAQAKN